MASERQEVVSRKWAVGMRLEARDRKNPEILAVACISAHNTETDEYTIHLDGWNPEFDYNAKQDDADLHPCGYWQFVQMTNYSIDSVKQSEETMLHNGLSSLEPPNGFTGTFIWSEYLSKKKASAAPLETFTATQTEGMTSDYFPHQDPSQPKPAATASSQEASKEDSKVPPAAPNPKKRFVGMKLEARDKSCSELLCVATVFSYDEKRDEFTIRFDGYNADCDYTTTLEDADLHPCGYWAFVQKTKYGIDAVAEPMEAVPHNGLQSLEPPKRFKGIFSWSKYLEMTESFAVPLDVFTAAQTESMTSNFFPPQDLERPRTSSPNKWHVGMKLEARDKKNPHMLAVATILSHNKKSDKYTINFDGWSCQYDYTTTHDDPDLHPCGYWQFIQKTKYNVDSIMNPTKAKQHENMRSLEAPYGFGEAFSWPEYLTLTCALPAPLESFTEKQAEGMTNDFFTRKGPPPPQRASSSSSSSCVVL